MRTLVAIVSVVITLTWETEAASPAKGVSVWLMHAVLSRTTDGDGPTSRARDHTVGHRWEQGHCTVNLGGSGKSRGYSYCLISFS